MARHHQRKMPNFNNYEQNAPLMDPALERSYNPGFERRGFKPKQNAFSARKKWDKKKNNDIGIMEERHLRNDSIYRWLAPEDPYGESSPAPVPARAPCSADPITAAGGWAQTAIIPSAMPSSCALSPEDSNDAFFAQIPETPSNTERSPYVSFDEEYTRDERLKHLGRTVAPKPPNSSTWMPEPYIPNRNIEGPGVRGFPSMPASAPPWMTGWDNRFPPVLAREPVRQLEPKPEFDVSDFELEPFQFDPKAPEFVPRQQPKRVKSPSLGMIVTGSG